MHPPDDLSDLVQRLEQTPFREDPQSSLTTPQPYQPQQSRRRSARQARKRKNRIIFTVILCALVMSGGGGAWAIIASGASDTTEQHSAQDRPKPTPEKTATAQKKPADAKNHQTPPKPKPEPKPKPAPQPQPAANSDLDNPNSYTVVVNKQRPLSPINWAPNDLRMPQGIPNSNGQPLRDAAATALEHMHAESSAAGLPFFIVSGFRDYNLQTSLFQNFSATDGVAAAETYSARPGHSEHQLGLAVDIVECQGCGLSESFGETAVGTWARDNAHRFGFILRYQQGEQPVVGFVYEPWHFRYVGVEVATDMKNKGVKNLEDYFGLPAAPTY